MTKKVKTIDDKINELYLGLDALKNANNMFIETKNPSFLLTIQAQLRGLIGMHGSTMNPLLINLSKQLNIPLELYSYAKQKLEKDMSFCVAIGKSWSPIQREGFCKYTLEDWLDTPLYLSDTTYNLNSRNQIIKNTSNFQGGTHYLDEVPHIVDTLLNISVDSTINALNDVLIDIAEAIFWLGHKLILNYQYKKINQDNTIGQEEKLKRIQELNERMNRHDLEFIRIDRIRQPLLIQGFK